MGAIEHRKYVPMTFSGEINAFIYDDFAGGGLGVHPYITYTRKFKHAMCDHWLHHIHTTILHLHMGPNEITFAYSNRKN